MSVIRAMVLAAGEGRRLRPITDRVPKALVEVDGRPLIEYSLATLRRAGIDEVIVNLHYLGSQIRSHLGDGSRYGVRIAYSEEEPLLGSGGGIAHARELLGDSTFVTVNADTIVDIDLRVVVDYHRANRATATMVLREDPRMEQFGLIRTESSGRIAQFLRHERADAFGPDGKPRTRLTAFMYSGVQVLEPRVFDYLAPVGSYSITETTYPAMLAAGEPLYGFPSKGRWLTVGTPDELAWANRSLREAPLDTR